MATKDPLATQILECVAEIDAMRAVVLALLPLSPQSQRQVLAWVRAAFDYAAAMPSPHGKGRGDE